MTSFNFTGPGAERSLCDWNNEQPFHPRLPAPDISDEAYLRKAYRGKAIDGCVDCGDDLLTYDIQRRYRRCRPCRGVTPGGRPEAE